MEVKKIAWDEEVLFTNWSDEDFETEYDLGGTTADGKRDVRNIRSYKLEKGKSYYLPHYLAIQFAKELAQREWNKEFLGNLEKMTKKATPGTDRRVIENQAMQMTKSKHQELIDKCVEQLPENIREVETPRPQQVKLREAVLNRDRRNLKVEEETGIKSQVNRKAIKEADEFN